jgi:hypothetical protein
MWSWAADFIWVLKNIIFCSRLYMSSRSIMVCKETQVWCSSYTATAWWWNCWVFLWHMVKHHIGVREAWCKQNERVGVTENLVVVSNQDQMFMTQYHFFCACEQATHNCVMALSFMASSNKTMRSYESV